MKAHLKVTHLLLGLLLGSLLTGPALAATYKWQDESGNTVYSQQPPPSGPYEIVKTRRSSSSPGYSRPVPSTPPPAPPKLSPEQGSDDSKVQAEVARTEHLRRQNCQAAKHNLELYTVYRRIKNDKGEVVRLADDERARRLQEAKDAIKEFCD